MKKNKLSTLTLSALVVLGCSVPFSVFAQTAPVTPPDAGVLAPATAPTTSPSALTALQQNINNQPVPVTPAQPQTPDPSQTLRQLENSDESTFLREAARQQARLNILRMMAEVEKQRLDMERERMKFAEEQQESRRNLGGAAPAGASAAPLSQPSSPSGVVAVQPATPAAEPAVADTVISVRSIYSFDGKSFAELVVGTNRVVAETGTELITGETIVSIRSGRVTVEKEGQTRILPLEGSAATTSQAIAPLPAASASPGQQQAR